MQNESLQVRAEVAARRRHEGQTRKIGGDPYITHPQRVATLLRRHECSDEAVCAGWLHDTVEDTDATFQDIEREFGPRIREMVALASENKDLPTWRERKQFTLTNWSQSDDTEGLLVVCADKLDNVRSLVRSIESLGPEKVLAGMNAPAADQIWYYSTAAGILAERVPDNAMVAELVEQVDRLCRLLEAAGD